MQKKKIKMDKTAGGKQAPLFTQQLSLRVKKIKESY
jgi:hypothetical protein